MKTEYKRYERLAKIDRLRLRELLETAEMGVLNDLRRRLYAVLWTLQADDAIPADPDEVSADEFCEWIKDDEIEILKTITSLIANTETYAK